MTVIKYPSIEQFRNVIYQVNYKTRYIGDDDKGQPLYNDNPLPTVKFVGTVKTHGTNAGIVFNLDETTGEYSFFTQSRENVITPSKDNAGFATFIYTKEIHKLLNIILNQLSEKPLTVAVYGEWIGKGIQKGVAVCELPKSMIVFGVKVDNMWLDDERLKNVKLPDERIYNVFDFKTFEIYIDFNEPDIAAKIMGELTEEVGTECPVGKAFGITGIGEGICWHSNEDGYLGSRYFFKTKDERHKVVKTKEKVAIDVEKVNSINELVATIVTEPRLNQGLSYLIENNMEVSMKNIGNYIKWVYNDVIKEELDTIVKNGFEPKQINSSISNKARDFYISELNKTVGLTK